MLNKLERFIRQNRLLEAGDRVICAVSGGADSMALLTAMYLLREKLGIIVEAAHFNHGLRGNESDEDERFVAETCDAMELTLHIGRQKVVAGKKGLEAAAREARYRFFGKLEGKIATAHTADDNAETVLLHLLRGTGLKGLGGIAPRRGNIVRPMLDITRAQVLAFLEEYHVRYREDSSNGEDRFLRNRIRHHVMPLLRQENPRIAQNLSAGAQRLRKDEEALQFQAQQGFTDRVSELKALPEAVRVRVLERFLKDKGVKEPEAEHLALVQALVFSERPSASAWFPGGIRICRCYDLLMARQPEAPPKQVILPCPGVVAFGEYRLVCSRTEVPVNTVTEFTVSVNGPLIVRSRCSGDEIRLSGGRKSLKKLYIDRKIPADLRPFLPVLCDDNGIVAAYGIGADLDHRLTDQTGWKIRITTDTGCL